MPRPRSSARDQLPLRSEAPVFKHPDGLRGATCDALTSHLDLAPTILGSTGLDDVDTSDLPGHDIMPVLTHGAGADLHTVRDGMLYAYNMFTLLDADFSAR